MRSDSVQRVDYVEAPPGVSSKLRMLFVMRRGSKNVTARPRMI